MYESDFEYIQHSINYCIMNNIISRMVKLKVRTTETDICICKALHIALWVLGIWELAKIFMVWKATLFAEWCETFASQRCPFSFARRLVLKETRYLWESQCLRRGWHVLKGTLFPAHHGILKSSKWRVVLVKRPTLTYVPTMNDRTDNCT